MCSYHIRENPFFFSKLFNISLNIYLRTPGWCERERGKKANAFYSPGLMTGSGARPVRSEKKSRKSDEGNIRSQVLWEMPGKQRKARRKRYFCNESWGPERPADELESSIIQLQCRSIISAGLPVAHTFSGFCPSWYSCFWCYFKFLKRERRERKYFPEKNLKDLNRYVKGETGFFLYKF